MDLPTQPAGTEGPLRGVIKQDYNNSLTAPTNIVQTLTAARAIYEQVRLDNLKRLELFASIEGLIQGNPPYDPLELEQAGLSHVANFNNLDGTSRYEKGALAFWNLLDATEYLAKFEFYDENNPEFQGYADILARNFDKVVREWKSFVRHFCCFTGQLIKFGYTALMWPDERDWRWEPIETARLFLPNQCSTDTNLITSIFIESVFTVQYLWAVYEEFKDKKKDESPWNMDALKSFLVFRANTWLKTASNSQITDIFQLQQRIQNGDTTLNWVYTDEVRLITLFQKEYSGKISHYIFSRFDPAPAAPTGSSGFLYSVDDQYDSLDRAFALFTANPDKFTVHSNLGLGHKIFAPCQATMQVDNDIVNMTRLSSTPFISSPNLGGRDFEPIVVRPGVPTNIGGAQFVQNNLGANIEQLVGANNYLLGKLTRNLVNSGDDPEFPDTHKGSQSDRQAQRQDYREQGVLKNNIAHFYTQFDHVLENMLYLMQNSKKEYPGYDEAERWKTLCINQGVPEILFEVDREGKSKYFCIKASRVAGDGSTLGLMNGLQNVSPFAGGFSAEGSRNFLKDIVRTGMGADYVSRYLGKSEPDESAGGASLAQVENIVMKGGESPTFSPDNEQRSHILSHIELAKYVINLRTQQQMSAVDADKIFTNLIPHLGEHIQFTARNPLQQNFLGQVIEPWKEIQTYAELNRKNARNELEAELRKRQEQEQKTQKVLTDEEIATMKAIGNEKRADYKVVKQVERADKANETRGEVQKEDVIRKNDTKRLQVTLDANNKRLKTELENQAPEPEDLPTPQLRQEIATLTGNTPSPSDFE